MRSLPFVLTLTVAACATTAPSVRQGPPDPGATPQERLARCLTRKGAKLYSTSWCPPCQQQEAAFGPAASLLTVVSCEKPGDPYEESEACKQAKITAYPTWEFPGGKRVKGFIDLGFLAEYAGCPWNP